MELSNGPALQTCDVFVPVPSNYFTGQRLSNQGLADNILLFRRATRRRLNQRSFEGRPHHRFVLVFNESTQGSINVDGESYRFEPGEGFLIAPLQFHFYLDLESDALSWLFLTFESNQPEALRPLVNQPVRLDDEDQRILLTLLRDYPANHSRATVDPRGEALSNVWILQCNRLIQRLLSHSMESGFAAALPTQANPTADRIINQVHENLETGEFSLTKPESLADSLHMSVSHLRRRFRQITGISLGHYQIHYRMNRAIKLLIHTDEALTGIAESCGYESLAAFSRAFKTNFGTTPSQYRKQMSPASGARSADPSAARTQRSACTVTVEEDRSDGRRD